MTRLSDRMLPDLGSDVATPSYDRSALQVGIVHLGMGNFHRAHQAWYLDSLTNQGQAMEWGICGVGGPRCLDSAMRDALTAQDCLYTVVEKKPDGTYDARVVGSVVDCDPRQTGVPPGQLVAVVDRQPGRLLPPAVVAVGSRCCPNSTPDLVTVSRGWTRWDLADLCDPTECQPAVAGEDPRYMLTTAV